MQVKATEQYHLSLVRMTDIKKTRGNIWSLPNKLGKNPDCWSPFSRVFILGSLGWSYECEQNHAGAAWQCLPLGLGPGPPASHLLLWVFSDSLHMQSKVMQEVYAHMANFTIKNWANGQICTFSNS